MLTFSTRYAVAEVALLAQPLARVRSAAAGSRSAGSRTTAATAADAAPGEHEAGHAAARGPRTTHGRDQRDAPHDVVERTRSGPAPAAKNANRQASCSSSAGSTDAEARRTRPRPRPPSASPASRHTAPTASPTRERGARRPGRRGAPGRVRHTAEAHHERVGGQPAGDVEHHAVGHPGQAEHAERGRPRASAPRRPRPRSWSGWTPPGRPAPAEPPHTGGDRGGKPAAGRCWLDVAGLARKDPFGHRGRLPRLDGGCTCRMVVVSARS